LSENTKSTTYGGGYTVADLDTMGGDEIRALGQAELRRMRRDALREAKAAVARLERATEYMHMGASRVTVSRTEAANLGEIKDAAKFLGKVSV
jgi:hypothetical protein